MIWNDVLKYTIKTGDPSRLINFLGATLIAGEIYNVARDYLTGREESVTFQLQKTPEEREIGRALINDLIDGGGIGMLADFTYGVFDWATGVSARTGRNIWEAVENIKTTPSLTVEALEKLAAKELSPYRQAKDVIRKVDEARDPANISTDYMRARAKAFRFSKEKEHPGVIGAIDGWLDSAMFGQSRFDIGDNSLAYEMIQRSIIVGDVEDAAQYVEHIIRNSDSPSKAAAGLKSSARSRSPLGPISAEHRAEFRDSMTPSEWEDFEDINDQFIDLYAEAVDIGKRRVR